MIIAILISIALLALWVNFIGMTVGYVLHDIVPNVRILLFEPRWFSFKGLVDDLVEIACAVFFFTVEILMGIGLFHLIPAMLREFSK